jgi:hypothetical protein
MFPKQVVKLRLGNWTLEIDKDNQASSKAEAREPDPTYGRTHEAISDIREINGWYVR